MKYLIWLWNFFLKTPIPAEWKSKNQFWGHIPPISIILLDWFFSKKKEVHPCVNPHQSCEIQENRFKMVICIVTVIIIISWKSRSAIFKCKLKNIHKALLLVSTLIQKKILWRINFVLIKFSLNALIFERSQNKCKNLSFLHKTTCIESEHV